MAIYHCSIKPVSRSAGRSAPAAAAYRAGVELVNERDGVVHNYTNRKGVDHAEIMLPAGRAYEWAANRSKLWNSAEVAENRKNSRVAREIVIALPHELSAEKRLELTRDFAQRLADQYGVAVDVAIHQPSEKGDERNVHAHLLLTTRSIEENGLGKKSHFEWSDANLEKEGLPDGTQQIKDVRVLWEERANHYLHEAGLDIRIDHRSHIERGLELDPTQNQGVHASNMQRDGKEIERLRLAPDAAQSNAERIIEKPERVLEIITAEKSVFDHRDVARVVNRYVDPAQFQQAYAAVMASPALEKLTEEKRLDDGHRIEAKLTTVKMLELEASMARHADSLAAKKGYGVDEKVVEKVFSEGPIKLSHEQQLAVQHLAGEERIAAVIGFAGAGKSTMLNAAREAWERGGLRVYGAALAGKAAEGLEESSGIESRTLASWERSWENDRNQLQHGDVLVIDEAGMVASPQLERFIREADERGAKIVLVGDDEQLQPIGPGAAFRAVVERVGKAEISEVRRQNEQWQRDASRQFGLHQTKTALEAYDKRGHIQVHEKAEQVRDAIVRDYIEDMKARPEGSRLALAHRNADVQELNNAIRAARQAQGELAEQRSYATTEGKREFAAGDRLLFRENNRDLGVKNGMLATVERAEADRLVVRLDNDKGPGQGRTVEVSTKRYSAIDHGYAATIHKSQGATVDRAFVRASDSMDRHMTYVAMTRHRQGVTMYAAGREFGSTRLEQAKAQMMERLSRSQAKETTLDYRDAYAGRRGLDPIVVKGRDVEKAVQRAAERQDPAAAHERPTAAPAFNPAEQIKRLSDFDLEALRYGAGKPKSPQEIEGAISNDPTVREYKDQLHQRDRLQQQTDQLRHKVAEIEGGGFLKRLRSGAELKDLKARLERSQRQLSAMPSRESLQANLQVARNTVLRTLDQRVQMTKFADAEYARRMPGRALSEAAKSYYFGRMNGRVKQSNPQLEAYLSASEQGRAQMREQANQKALQGMEKSPEPSLQLQKQKAYQRDRGDDFGL